MLEIFIFGGLLIATFHSGLAQGPMTPETQSFDNLIRTKYASALNTTDIEEVRHQFDLIAQENQVAFDGLYPNGLPVTENSLTINVGAPSRPIQVYIYTPNGEYDQSQVLVFLHASGHFYSDIVTYRPTAQLLAVNLGLRIVYVEYRKAPEYPYPAAVDDCFDALKYFIDNKEAVFGRSNIRIGLLGEISGAMYGAYATNVLKSSISYQILINPRVSTKQSDIQDVVIGAYGPKFLVNIIKTICRNNYFMPAVQTYGLSVINSTKMSPAYYVTSDTPRTLLIGSQLDILYDQLQIYQDALKANEVPFTYFELAGTTRFFFEYPTFFPTTFNSTLNSIKAFLNN